MAGIDTKMLPVLPRKAEHERIPTVTLCLNADFSQDFNAQLQRSLKFDQDWAYFSFREVP